MLEIIGDIFTVEFGFAILRVSTPIIFATMGAMITSRAGVFNIALEGIMLLSALLGVIFSAYFASIWFSLLLVCIIAAFAAFLLGFLSLNLKADIFLTGIAFNIIAAGGTVFLLNLVTGQKGVSISLKSQVFPKIDIPLIQDIPILGPIISGHSILTYIALFSVFAIYYLVNKTALGLRIRAVGEQKNAAESVGIDSRKVQYISLIISGVLCGFGGAFMSMGYLSWFGANMVAGRGFIAMAANGMGGGTAIGGFIVSLFFGTADALSNSLQSFGDITLPTEFIQMLPYLMTIIGLVMFNVNKKRKKAREQ